jgi:hypothetical protein
MRPFFILVIAMSVLRSSVLLDCIRWGGLGGRLPIKTI